MIEITRTHRRRFDLQIGHAECKLLYRIAKAYALPTAPALAAVINKGLDVIGKRVDETEKPEHDHEQGS